MSCSSLLLVVFLSQIHHADAATCTTELILTSVLGGVLALLLIALVLYCCITRRREARKIPVSTKSLVSSVEEGGSQGFANSRMDFTLADVEMQERESEERQLCSQCHQRMRRANIEMPTVAVNIGMSTSEERLPVNGSFSEAGSVSPVDEPRIFVFVEKKEGESLGLYLVPFEEEPLTGLYVKTIVAGKSAARLHVFDPGDKIVTVNGKSLSGLTYREATDFIRHCPGPNVKMGIIKHALHKKEDLAKLDSMSVFQSHSGADLELAGSAALGVSGHASAARLSGNVPKPNLVGGEGASKELVVEEQIAIAKPEISYNVESTPDFGMDFDGFGGKTDNNLDISGGIDTNANLDGKGDASGGDVNIDFTPPAGIFDADLSMPGPSASTEDLDSDSSVENRPPENRRLQKSSYAPRRSHSNPQIRPRHLVEQGVDVRPAKYARYSPDQHRSPGREIAIGKGFNYPAFHAEGHYAVAKPLTQRSPDSRGFSSYLVPLSDEPSSRYFSGNAGMIKSKSLDKLDEIMRNDPILGEDYLGTSPSSASKSIQTQTDTVYRKKKPRRKRNDRPRSQILPPTYLQLPSVTCMLPNELGSTESLQKPAQTSASHEVRHENYLDPSYNRATHRRRSKEEQAQIVQRWINEMIEHKKAQELRRQNIVRQSVGRERSTKLKKKSRSVPEHSFRGNQAKFERRRSSDQSADTNGEYVDDVKLRHSDSDPSFRSQMSVEDRYHSGGSSSVSIATTQTIGTEEMITPSLQSRIRSLEQSFQQNNTSSSSLQSNNNSLESGKHVVRHPTESSPRLARRRSRTSNPDLPLISHLLSGGELDSQC